MSAHAVFTRETTIPMVGGMENDDDDTRTRHPCPWPGSCERGADQHLRDPHRQPQGHLPSRPSSWPLPDDSCLPLRRPYSAIPFSLDLGLPQDRRLDSTDSTARPRSHPPPHSVSRRVLPRLDDGTGLVHAGTTQCPLRDTKAFSAWRNRGGLYRPLAHLGLGRSRPYKPDHLNVLEPRYHFTAAASAEIVKKRPSLLIPLHTNTRLELAVDQLPSPEALRSVNSTISPRLKYLNRDSPGEILRPG